LEILEYQTLVNDSANLRETSKEILEDARLIHKKIMENLMQVSLKQAVVTFYIKDNA
jgi:hypothetical protein